MPIHTQIACHEGSITYLGHAGTVAEGAEARDAVLVLGLQRR